MSLLISPHETACPRCNWSIAVGTVEEKQRREAVHAHSSHGEPMPEQPVTGATWQEMAVDAVRQVAARGHDFTIFEALSEFGLASPPNARTALGRFASLIHDLQLAHVVGYAPSARKGTRRSAAAVWSRDVRRCRDEACKRKAGVA